MRVGYALAIELLHQMCKIVCSLSKMSIDPIPAAKPCRRTSVSLGLTSSSSTWQKLKYAVSVYTEPLNKACTWLRDFSLIFAKFADSQTGSFSSTLRNRRPASCRVVANRSLFGNDVEDIQIYSPLHWGFHDEPMENGGGQLARMAENRHASIGHGTSIQGGPSGRGQPFVDIAIRVAL